MNSRKDEIVLSYEDTLLRESDFKLLDRGNWINDNIISFWFSYLTNNLVPKKEQLYLCVSPEVTQLIKSTQNSKDLLNDLKVILDDSYYSTKSVLFIPINDADYTNFRIAGNHWSLLVFHKNKPENLKFEHYDSLYSSNYETAKMVSKILNELFCDGLASDPIEMPIVKQINPYDCGIHLLCTVEALINKWFINSGEDFNPLLSLSTIKTKRDEIKNTILELKSKDD